MNLLPEPDFIDRDPQTITAEIVAHYEQLTGKTLYPAQVERLLINIIAYRETLVRIGIQEAAKQNLVAFARAPMLDYLGELVSTLSEYYLRAQVVAGALVFYVQRGTLTDTTPISLKGTIGGEFGGGFASTPVDICVARILTGAPGIAPTVQQVINRGTLSWSATLNGNGTIYLPFDPFIKTGRLTASDVTPHATAVTGIQHGSGGWTGRTNWYAVPTGVNGAVPVYYSLATWSNGNGISIFTNNYIGDVTIATCTGMFEHIAGKSMWQTMQMEHKIGDTDGTYGDEHLLTMGTKNLLDADYENGLAISFSNCLNATLTWEILR